MKILVDTPSLAKRRNVFDRARAPPSGHTSRPSSKQIHGSYLLLAVMQDIRGRGDYPTYVFFFMPDNISFISTTRGFPLFHAAQRKYERGSPHPPVKTSRTVGSALCRTTNNHSHCSARNGDDWVRLRIPVKLRGGGSRVGKKLCGR